MSVIWNASDNDDTIYEVDSTDGSVLSSFASPETVTRGLAVDESGNVWNVGGLNDTIYKLDPSDGSVLSSFASPGAIPQGLAIDGDGNLWNSDSDDATLYKLNTSGSQLGSISSPGTDPRGLAVDRDGNLWNADDSGDTVYKVDPADGTVLTSWAAPSTGTQEGLTVDVDGNVWLADGATIFKLDPSNGSQLDSFSAPGSGPTGLAWDAWIHNEPPNAPNLSNPIGGATIDRTTTERFTWDFSDPDSGDAQSKFDLQIRAQGSATNDVDTSETTTNEFYDLSPNTLTAGDYEWRCRTYDQDGDVGPWSDWEPFSAEDPPDPPTITDPTSGSTISTDEYVVEWSTPEQDAYQLRRVADSGGSPDTSTVLFDTGTVESVSTRSRAVEFPTNNQFEHIQTRVRFDGLWGDWASNRVEVSYTPPPDPTVTITVFMWDGAEAALDVGVSNPTPGTGEPSVTENEVWRRKSGISGSGIRVGKGIANDGGHRDWTVASGVDYEYRAKAIGDNGTSAWSAWTGAESGESTLVWPSLDAWPS